MHLTARFVLDPSRDFSARPQTLIGRRSLQSLAELLLEFMGQDSLSTRIAMAMVDQGVRTSFVVAVGDRADPSQSIASVFDNLFRRFALGQQPHDLPMTAGNRAF